MSLIKGPTLQDLQEKLAKCHYLIVYEMSMIGRRQMGMIHSRLCQVFPGRSSQPCGGTSLILVGDFGQLPPVGDTPLYMAAAKGVLSNKGRAMYTEFGAAVVLTQVMRQAGTDPAQVRFREALLRLRNAEVTDDWHLIMTRTAGAAQRNGEDLTSLLKPLDCFIKWRRWMSTIWLAYTI